MQVVLANGAELFPRVVCGVDGSAAGEEAVRQALLLSDPRGQLVLAVGSHGIGRVAGILTGSVATAVVHRAHCSVLIARAGGSAGPFPSRIVVGVDGSALSLEAVWIAQRLAERVGAKLELIAAAGAAAGSADPQVHGLGEVRRDERDPVVALLAACDDAALLVVGSRGLGGVRALGSVSERVAHRAPVSVLVVRSGEPGASRYAGTAD
jgi:nucleotide-binding universal stress UspA family protein